MKQTVAELFSADSGRAYIPMMWGGREESPAEIGWRIWSSMRLIKEHIQGDSRQDYPDAVWTVLADNDLEYRPIPDTLKALEQLSFKETEDNNGVPTGQTTVQLNLAPQGPQSTAVASLHTLAGDEHALAANSVNFSFQPEFPLGTAKQASELFQGLVRIWQPDAGILSTKQTIRQIPNLYDTYAGYLTWISSLAFGAPPELASAHARPFGDGTLLMATAWTIDGLREMHRELLSAGGAALTSFPRRRQRIPEFPMTNIAC